MPTQGDPSLDQFTELIKYVVEHSPESLERKELGEINFSDQRSLFDEIHNFFSAAQQANWEALPLSRFAKLKTAADPVRQRLHQVVTFSTRDKSNPSSERNTICGNLLTEWGLCYDALAPHVAYLLATASTSGLSTTLDTIKDQAKQNLDWLNELRRNAQKDRDFIQADLKQATDMLESMRDFAKEKGVTQEAAHFKRLADKDFISSLVWILLAAVVGVITYRYVSNWHQATVAPISSLTNSVVASTVPSVVPSASGSTRADVFALIENIVPRLVTITLLLTGMVFFLRNYVAAAHNRVVNRHRQTALTTFTTFVSSAGDSQIKNAVLLQATQAIFQPQPSGYLKGDNELPQVAQVEVIKAVTGGREG